MNSLASRPDQLRQNKVSFQCCFTSTATMQTVWDVEPRTAISSFTQLLTSESKVSKKARCSTSTETIRLISDRDGGMEVGEEGGSKMMWVLTSSDVRLT